jgi:hypothetical protein
MIIIFASINAIILTCLSALHFYWMCGGKFGFAQSLPTTAEGKRVLNPRPFECGIMAIIFLFIAIFFLNFAGIQILDFPNWVLKYGLWLLSGIFLLRAIGDFKYIGFTKIVRTTEFAQLDSKYYAPLCLFLSVTSGLLDWWFGQLVFFVH